MGKCFTLILAGLMMLSATAVEPLYSKHDYIKGSVLILTNTEEWVLGEINVISGKVEEIESKIENIPSDEKIAQAAQAATNYTDTVVCGIAKIAIDAYDFSTNSYSFATNTYAISKEAYDTATNIHDIAAEALEIATESYETATNAYVSATNGYALAINYTDSSLSDFRTHLQSGDIVAENANNAGTAYSLTATTEKRDAAEIFAAIDSASRMTTNDVCNIVTNETIQPTSWIVIPAEYQGKKVSVEFDGLGWVLLADTDRIGERNGDIESTYLAWNVESESDYTATRQMEKINALGLARLSDIPSTNGFITAQTATNIAETISASVISSIDTSYVRTIGLTNKNQTVQYVNITDSTPSVLSIQIPTNGETKDWIVYVIAETNVTLQLPPATYWMQKAAYTNDIVPNVPTMLYFSQISDGVFSLGRVDAVKVDVE